MLFKICYHFTTDIMECNNGLHNCSQVCIELQGDFSCACYGGYELLEDGVSCKGRRLHLTTVAWFYRYVVICVYNVTAPTLLVQKLVSSKQGTYIVGQW